MQREIQGRGVEWVSEWKIGKYHLWVQFQGISFIFGKCTIDRNSGAAAAVSIPGKSKGLEMYI